MVNNNSPQQQLVPSWTSGAQYIIPLYSCWVKSQRDHLSSFSAPTIANHSTAFATKTSTSTSSATAYATIANHSTATAQKLQQPLILLP